MIKRSIKEVVDYYLDKFPVVLIIGARQVGKSTLCSTYLEKGYQYVSLDNIENRRLAVEEPSFFFRKIW